MDKPGLKKASGRCGPFPLSATAAFRHSPGVLAKVFSGAGYGVDAFEVEIEVNASSGNAVIVVVGLPDAAVKESKDRVTTAVQNSGFRWPRGRTTINLAPADVK